MNNFRQLQGIGKVEAKAAASFKIGEKMAWNYGCISEIIEVVKETKTQIVFKMKGFDPLGKYTSTYERRFKKDRLVAIR